MGKNKKVRKKIAGRDRQIASHEEKIAAEEAKPHPDMGAIRHWQTEICN
ncbi:MAG: hypothetical protein ACRD3O_12325 [Terriglobia bacterium]